MHSYRIYRVKLSIVLSIYYIKLSRPSTIVPTNIIGPPVRSTGGPISNAKRKWHTQIEKGVPVSIHTFSFSASACQNIVTNKEKENIPESKYDKCVCLRYQNIMNSERVWHPGPHPERASSPKMDLKIPGRE